MKTKPIIHAIAGRSLPGEYYTCPQYFENDVERIFFRDWLYVGHISQIPAPGEFFTYELAGESLVIMRVGESEVKAFFNVCRHRGARIVGERCGVARTLRCPYHNWTYNLDGSLRAAPGMSGQFDANDFGLRSAWVDVWQGFLYINLSEEKPMQTMSERFAPADESLAGHQLPRLKIAKTIVYDVPCNWKLLMENYRECYHCRAAHPQFCATVPVQDLDANRGQESTRLVNQRFGTFTKYCLREGAVSQSISGDAVSIPLGDLSPTDSMLRNLSSYPAHAFAFGMDYGFAFGLQPQSATQTTLTAHWYVNEQAVEGVDYEADAVAEFWDVTTRQDIFLCTINQQGVNSRRYAPGPYHIGQEDDVMEFQKYYLEMLES
jgi:Rieske 2Fe-2S family protein